jgi:ABC-type multidrug transport system fused ATPase/permease subunit
LSFNQLRKAKQFVGNEVWLLFWQASFFGFVLFLIESSFIFVLQGFLVAVGLVESSKMLLPSWYPKSLLSAVLILFAFGASRALAYVLKGYLAGRTYQAFMKVQRKRILSYALENAGELPAHEIISVFMERVTQVGGALHGASQLVMIGTTSVLFFVLGLRLAPLELLLGILGMMLVVLPLRSFNVVINASAKALIVEWEEASRSLVQGLKNQFFLKIYGLVPKEVEKGRVSLDRYAQHYDRYYLIANFKNALPVLCGVFIISLITYLSTKYIHTPPIKLVSFFYIFMRLAQGGSEIDMSLSDLRLHFPGLKMLYSWHLKFLAHAQAIKDEQRERSLDEASRIKLLALIRQSGVRVSLRSVTFGFDEKPLFKDLSLLLQRGDVLVIQGESGVGKSTLLSLILGLLIPTQGEVQINEYPAIDAKEIMSNFVGYVGPEPFLISGSVRDNLLYGHTEPSSVSDERIWSALNKAQLSSVIASLPHQLDEMLLESAQLSTGQKQRLAIARALLRDMKMLILDEASANLDEVTEQRFIDSLKELLPELTTVVISHKSTFDRIATQRLLLKRLT